MTKRQRFLDHVRHGGPPICSPQIGGGAGFDTRLAGKEWISQTTLGDTIAAVERFDIVPLINVGLPDLGCCDDKLAWRQVDRQESDDRIETHEALETPVGTLVRKGIEEKRKGFFQPKYPVETADDLPALEHYIDAALAADLAAVTAGVRRTVEEIADRAALSVQWSVQPYELLCFPDNVNTVLIAHDCPETFRRLMDKILKLDERLFAAVAAGGADFIFLGGPGSEMISPRFYEDYLIPYSQRASAMARAHGLAVYSHICSRIEPFLSMGFYNRMGIDLFETLSPPPVGNVESLRDARTIIDPAICTRGNLGLDVLLSASPEVVREKTLEILQAVEGHKHIVAASDYLFYDVPEANICAMTDAVNAYNGR